MHERFSIPGVDAVTPLSEAAPSILLAKAGLLFDLETVARDGMDADAVHDMRVASRRLREAIRLLAPAYGDRGLVRWRQRVRAITRALGPVRDADVFVDALSSVRLSLGEDGQRAAVFLVGYSLGQRDRDLTSLRALLSDIGLVRTRRRFERAVRKVRPEAMRGRPLSWLARDAIAARAEVVLTAQERAVATGGIVEHHELRIAYKRLRYAVEVFAPCYGDAFGDLHDTLRAFQDALGDLQDMHVFSSIIEERYRDGSAARADVGRGGLDAVLEAFVPGEQEALERFGVLTDAHPVDALMRAMLAPFDENEA
ncbi:MAG: CHAD domain-containing protein [Coriobacteriia bacterium]|nr:CHAD domain-containing protein [Coriobacteriia bacterium]